MPFAIHDRRGREVAQLEGKTFAEAVGRAVREGLSLAWLNLDRADLAGARLREADLRGASLCQANLDQAQLESAELTGAELSRASLRQADLSWARLTGARLEHVWATDACFRNAWMVGASFIGARLDRADLTGANGEGVNFVGVNFRFARLPQDLRGACLSATCLDGAKLGWSSPDLLAEIFRREARRDPERLKLAGLLRIGGIESCEELWEREHPLRDWVLEALRPWARFDGQAPEGLRKALRGRRSDG